MSLTTPQTLLDKICAGGDDEAWDRFYAFYAPLIVGFCLQKGCSRATADDVLQETMVSLLRQMRGFVYDPSRGHFRSYLLKIVHRQAIKAWHRQERNVSVEEDDGGNWLANAADSQADMPGLDWDALFDQRLLASALALVQERVSPIVYTSFELSVIQELPISEVMARLGIPNANAVYQHRNRVMRYLCEAVDDLRREMDL